MDQVKRIEWLDIAKGVAIFLVVLGHSGESPIKGYVYAFHMPLFFMLAGYTAALSYTRRKSPLSFIKGRFVSLFVPMVTWALFCQLFFCSRETFLCFDVTHGLHDLLYGTVNVWFIPALLCLQTFYLVFELATCKKQGGVRNIFIISILLALEALLFYLHREFGMSWHGLGWNIEWLTNAYNFSLPFALGVALYKQGDTYIKLTSKRCKQLFTVTTIIALLGWGQVHGVGILNGNYVKAFIGSCISYMLLVTLANSTLPAWFSKQATLVGKHTLIIYLAARLFQASNFCHFQGFNALLASLIYGSTSLATCYACIIFAKVVEKSPLLSLLLLGKISHRS